jgi:hypothetical protein
MADLTSGEAPAALSSSLDRLERQMRSLTFPLTCVLTVTAGLLLTGCGGGIDVGVDVSPPPSAAFDIGAKLNGYPLASVDVFPNEDQTIQVQTGDVLELDSSGPVSWETVAGSTAGIPTQGGATVVYGGVNFTETISMPGQLTLAVSSPQPLAAPVPLTIYATSLDDASQTARIDLVVTR